jgi:hypothetical protein
MEKKVIEKRFLILLALTFLLGVSLSCDVYFLEPTPTPIPTTSTPVPPTLTPSPIPPTCTPTPVPLGALLMGEWAFEEAGDQYVFGFNDGVLTISMDGESIEARYTIDLSHDPYHMDWINEDGEVILIIFEFIDENTIRMFGNDTDEIRPTEFGEDTIILKRITESE